MNKPITPEEQAAALAVLQPRQGFPTATASGQTSRLHGRFATLGLTVVTPQFPVGTFSGTNLLCFHWEIEFNQEFADATAHGDFWRVRLPLTQDWTGRVQGYMTRAGTSYLASISDNISNAGIGADPLPMTLTLYNDEGTHAIFTGACWGQRGRVMAPMAMVTQEMELVSAAVPTVLTVV